MRFLFLLLFIISAIPVLAQVSEKELVFSIPSPPPDYPQTKSGFYFTKDSSYLSVVEKTDLPAARFCKKIKRVDFLECKKLSLEKTVVRLQEMRMLVSLSFVSCNLRAFPESVTALINLRSLTVVADSFATLPVSIQRLNQLVFLNLGDDLYGGNALESLPEEIIALKKLRFLFLFGNNLKRLPEAIEYLPLEELRLRYNALTDVDALAVVSTLRELDLSDNPLVEFSALGALQNLEVLKMSGCDFRYIPASFSQLLRLKSLYLGRNGGLDADASFLFLAKLPALDFLSLDRCGWSRLPKLLGTFPVLASLSLMANPQLDLAQVCRTLKPLASLKRLDLTNCGIRTLPPELGELTQLTHLRLGLNELMSVDEI
ncbi:MAG: leucine-rich repeat domain-containing protein, partial [Bacteroidia bacterium]